MKLLLGIGLLGGEWLGHWQGAGVGDDDVFAGPVPSVGLALLDFAHDAHSLNNLSKHDVTSIEPSCLLGCDEKLRPVGVFACAEK